MKTAPHPVAPEEVMALVDGELPCERVEAVRVHVDLCPECSGVARRRLIQVQLPSQMSSLFSGV